MGLRISELIERLKKNQSVIPAEVMEKLEQYEDKTTLELMGIQAGDLQQQQLWPCKCNRLVHFCTEIPVPGYIRNPQTLLFSGFSYDISCLECIIDECTATIEDVPNPCNPNNPIPSVDITLDALRILGCIRFDLSLSVFDGDAPFFNQNSFGGSGIACVNNVTCVAPASTLDCEDFDINNTPLPVINLSASNPIPTPCGNHIIPVEGDFVLPTCETAACSIIDFVVDPVTICEDDSFFIFGLVVDCNGLIIENATVNFTVSDPSLGDVNPDSITTNLSGFFSTRFTSTNGPGTVTVIATVEGTNITEDWTINIIDCTP